MLRVHKRLAGSSNVHGCRYFQAPLFTIVLACRPDARRGIHQLEAVLTESLDRLSRDLGDIAGLYKRLAYWRVRIMTLADGKVASFMSV